MKMKTIHTKNGETIEVKHNILECPQCSGTMYHSDDMENPFAGDDDKTPFYQCEDCSYVMDDEA